MSASMVDLAKLAKLLEARHDLTLKQLDLDEEIDAILNGKAGIGARIKRFEDGFKNAWRIRYQGEYVFTPTRDKPQIKRLLKLFGDDELQNRIDRYTLSDDPFYAKNRHSFGIFTLSINSHVGAVFEHARSVMADAPADCRHQPACRSDQEHTKRRTADMRGLAF